MTPEEIVVSLAKFIRDQVRPHMGAMQGRRLTGTATSGDATFAIDDIAEEAIVQFIEQHQLSIAYYSEDKGLIEFGERPEGVLVIDPIDGTRPAMAGFEQCVVSVAMAEYTPDVTFGDVHYGCIAELKRDDIFVAKRGGGAQWIQGDGSVGTASLLPVTEIRHAPLTFELAGRPLEYVGTVLDGIANAASITAGCFLLNSTAYALTRLMTGQLAAVLDVGNRIMRDIPDTRARFEELGRGKAIGLFTYDIAAAALIAEEAGAVVTDAYGRSLAAAPLLDTSQSNLHTICAASTPELHAALVEEISSGIWVLADRLAL